MKRYFWMCLCLSGCLTLTVGIGNARGFSSEPLRENQSTECDAGSLDRESYVVKRLESFFTESGDREKARKETPGRIGRELTMLLREALQNYMFYSDRSRAVVDRFLFRPTESSNTWPWDDENSFYLPDPVSTFKPSVEDYPHIGGRYTFWYVTHSIPDAGNRRHTTTLAFVKTVADALEYVYEAVVDELGFPGPVSDGAILDDGGDDTRDVYLMNCGSENAYGYTMPLSPNRICPSYMVLDNNFMEFASNLVSAEQAMKVTVAHEFNHAVQFSINSYADIWIMEATSCWMESRIYPEIPDNIQYLNGDDGFFAMPYASLDNDAQLYNSWIFMEYLTLKWGDQVVETIWDYLAYRSDGILAVTWFLGTVDSDLKTVFAEFVQKNYSRTGFYPESDAFDPVHMANDPGQTLDHSTDTSHLIEEATVRVDHLAAEYFRYVPGHGIEGERLLIEVHGADGRDVQAAVTVKKTDGSFAEKTIVLDDKNDGFVYVADFSNASVDEVVVQLINASTDQDETEMTVAGGLGLKSSMEKGDGGGCFIESLNPTTNMDRASAERTTISSGARLPGVSTSGIARIIERKRQ